jgi:hypothetical protein
MATTTAIILIGQAHPNDSGINPTHLMQLTENDRPALILQNIGARGGEVVIIPTLENLLDDIYLTIAVYVLGIVNPPRSLDSFDKKSLYDIFSSEERQRLYEETKDALQKNRFKVTFNILEGSHLLQKVEQIKQYPNDFEVTLPAFKKEFDIWSGSVVTKGI